HPFTQKTSGRRTNIVRQAGCAYAMAAAAARERDPARLALLEASAVSAIEFLLNYAGRAPNGAVYITQPGDGQAAKRQCKLGTLALCLLAMQHGALSQKYHQERSALVDTILSLQNSDGSF